MLGGFNHADALLVAGLGLSVMARRRTASRRT